MSSRVFSSLGTRTYNGVYEATNEISATNVTILNGTSVTFSASGSVILQDGFTVESGAYFYSDNKGCSRGCNSTKSSVLNTEQIIIEQSIR